MFLEAEAGNRCRWIVTRGTNLNPLGGMLSGWVRALCGIGEKEVGGESYLDKCRV